MKQRFFASISFEIIISSKFSINLSSLHFIKHISSTLDLKILCFSISFAKAGCCRGVRHSGQVIKLNDILLPDQRAFNCPFKHSNHLIINSNLILKLKEILIDR